MEGAVGAGVEGAIGAQGASLLWVGVAVQLRAVNPVADVPDLLLELGGGVLTGPPLMLYISAT